MTTDHRQTVTTGGIAEKVKGENVTSTTKKADTSATKRKRSQNVPRAVQTPTEIVESVSRTSSHYKVQSDELKRESLRASIAVDLAIMSAVYDRGRVDLDNPEELAEQAKIFLQACSEAGCIPTFEKYCASLGYSRVTVYSYLKNNPNTRSAEVIEHVRSIFMDLLQEQGLQRNFAESLSIFLLKNCKLGYTDRPEEGSVVRVRDLPSIEQLTAQMGLLDNDKESSDGLPFN